MYVPVHCTLLVGTCTVPRYSYRYIYSTRTGGSTITGGSTTTPWWYGTAVVPVPVRTTAVVGTYTSRWYIQISFVDSVGVRIGFYSRFACQTNGHLYV